jgi:crotonobetainyl-CoA:carnitine CoA-transferase CaiB-like acyl-CoA transferase
MTALAGRRILELADEQGEYCGKLFADMGADVVKVERPGGDATREHPPFWTGASGRRLSLSFLYRNTSKRSVTLDLRRREGADLFSRLAASADAVIETWPAGALEELGLGPGDLRREHPALVVTSLSGFGRTGPQRSFESSDLVANALGGTLYVHGYAEDPPVRLAGSHAHVMTSTCAAAATMIALHHAARTGDGQHVDVAAIEVMAAVSHICGIGKWLDDGIVPRRAGTGLFASVPSGAYPCRDGLVYLMVNRPLHWEALARWIHEETENEAVLSPLFRGPSSARYEFRELLDDAIAELTARYTVAEAVAEGQRRHLAMTAVASAAAVAADEQLAARGFFVDVEHPGEGVLRYPGAPYRHHRTPWRLRSRAPEPGEHSEDVLCGELGVTAEQLAELGHRGVV